MTVDLREPFILKAMGLACTQVISSKGYIGDGGRHIMSNSPGGFFPPVAVTHILIFPKSHASARNVNSRLVPPNREGAVH